MFYVDSNSKEFTSSKVVKNIASTADCSVCFTVLVEGETQDTYYVSPAASERLKKRNQELFQNIPSGFYICAEKGKEYQLQLNNQSKKERKSAKVYVDGQLASSWTLHPDSTVIVKGFEVMKEFDCNGITMTVRKFVFSADSTAVDGPKEDEQAGTIEVKVHQAILSTSRRSSKRKKSVEHPAKHIKLSSTSKAAFHTQITTTPGEEISVTAGRSGYAAGEFLHSIKCYYKPRFWLEHAGIIKTTPQNTNNNSQGPIVIEDDQVPQIDTNSTSSTIPAHFWDNTKDRKITLPIELNQYDSSGALMLDVIQKLNDKLHEDNIPTRLALTNCKIKYRDNEGDSFKIVPAIPYDVVKQTAVEIIVENKPL